MGDVGVTKTTKTRELIVRESMANAEEGSGSEERDEEAMSRSRLDEILRERSWRADLERTFGSPLNHAINLHLTRRHVLGRQQVLIRIFPPTCLVCVMLVRACVYV